MPGYQELPRLKEQLVEGAWRMSTSSEPTRTVVWRAAPGLGSNWITASEEWGWKRSQEASLERD